MWLDLCIIDDYSKLINFGQHAMAFLSTHDLICIGYKIKVQRYSGRLIACRDYRHFSESEFLSELQNFDWSHLANVDCMDHKVHMFNFMLLECIDKHAPLEKVHVKNLPAPWITTELKVAMRERDLARRLWRRKRDASSYNNFKAFRNKIQSLVRTAKRTYYLAIFSQPDNPAETWRRLRQLGLIKPKDGLCTSSPFNR